MNIREYSKKDSKDRNYMRLFRWITGATQKAYIPLSELGKWAKENPHIIKQIAEYDRTLARAVFYAAHGHIANLNDKKMYTHEGYELEFDRPIPEFLK